MCVIFSAWAFFKYIGGPSLRNLKDWMEGRYLEGPGTITL